MKVLVLSDAHYDFYASDEARAFYHEDVGKLDAVVIPGDTANSDMMCEEFFDLMEECFDDVPLRVATPGNHDGLWFGPGSFQHAGEPGFHQIATEHGFIVPNPDKLYEVIDDVLLFNMFYSPSLTDEEIAYTNDPMFFDVRGRCVVPNIPKTTPKVRFSVSHMVPHGRIPSKLYNPRHRMFCNDDVDAVLRAHKSPVHFYGHDHEWNDVTLDGVRYINTAIGYQLPVAPLLHLVKDV